jgi:hypothetical protein
MSGESPLSRYFAAGQALPVAISDKGGSLTAFVTRRLHIHRTLDCGTALVPLVPVAQLLRSMAKTDNRSYATWQAAVAVISAWS